MTEILRMARRYQKAKCVSMGREPWRCMVRENGLTTTSVKRIQKDPASYGVLFVTGEND
jgi:hypothetical protein